MRKRLIQWVIAICIVSTITSCGLSGRLYLPPQETKQHWFYHFSIYLKYPIKHKVNCSFFAILKNEFFRGGRGLWMATYNLWAPLLLGVLVCLNSENVNAKSNSSNSTDSNTPTVQHMYREEHIVNSFANALNFKPFCSHNGVYTNDFTKVENKFKSLCLIFLNWLRGWKPVI